MRFELERMTLDEARARLKPESRFMVFSPYNNRYFDLGGSYMSWKTDFQSAMELNLDKIKTWDGKLVAIVFREQTKEEIDAMAPMQRLHHEIVHSKSVEETDYFTKIQETLMSNPPSVPRSTKQFGRAASAYALVLSSEARTLLPTEVINQFDQAVNLLVDRIKNQNEAATHTLRINEAIRGVEREEE